MAKRLPFLLTLIVLISACAPQPASAPQSTVAPPTSTQPPPPTATPTLAPTTTFTPIPTPTLTPTQTPDPLFGPLGSLLKTQDLESMGFPADTVQKWQEFASTKSGLTPQELASLQAFIAQWTKWEAWFKDLKLAKDQQPEFKVRIVETDESQSYALYLYDEAILQKTGVEQLYLPQHPQTEKLSAILLAPVIEGYTQQISADGEDVEYLDSKGRAIVVMDAYYLVAYKNSMLFNRLVKSFPKNKQLSVFPRYQYPLKGMKASWYELDKVLTATQILSLKETLELFERPNLEGLIPTVFGEEQNYFIVDKIEEASGYELARIIHLDRKDLFGDKIILAGVIAHEAAHTIQPSPMHCRAEIGLGTIPNEFYGWSADELIAHIKEMDIGAEHVELWVWNQLGASKWMIDWSRKAILAKGRGYWSYCK